MKLAAGSLALLFGLSSPTPPARAADWPSAYASAEADTAEDCARLCADDTLCNVWLYRPGVCGFSASVPASADGQAIAGLSPHAPAFMRLQFAPPEPASAQAPKDAPQAGPGADVQRAAEAEAALLGGPDADALRPRLALRR